MNSKKQMGAVSVVVAAVVAAWVYGRITSFLGQLQSWSYPFNEYEIVTIIGGLGGLFFLVIGMRWISTPDSPAKKSD